MKSISNQKLLFLTIFSLIFGLHGCIDNSKQKEETNETVDTSAQLNMLTTEIYGKELEYEFKDYVTIDLTYGSDTTLYWIERESKVDANEIINTIHLDKHTITAGWNESDGTKVALYSDFVAGKTYGYQFFKDGKIRNLIGTIKLKK